MEHETGAIQSSYSSDRKAKIGSGMRGDKIITKSGMHGKVAELNDKDSSCVIETSAGKIKFDRSAISMEMSSKLNAPVAKK